MANLESGTDYYVELCKLKRDFPAKSSRIQHKQTGIRLISAIYMHDLKSWMVLKVGEFEQRPLGESCLIEHYSIHIKQGFEHKRRILYISVLES
jgi:hypothetical protein